MLCKSAVSFTIHINTTIRILIVRFSAVQLNLETIEMKSSTTVQYIRTIRIWILAQLCPSVKNVFVMKGASGISDVRLGANECFLQEESEEIFS